MNNTRKLETSLVFLLKAILNLILFFVLYGIYAKSNWQLWNLSRTSGITIAAYVVMHYMFSTIYGHYDIGKRKSKPIVLSLFLNQVFTDVISVIVLSIMNTNQMKNQSFKLEQPYLLLPIIAIQFVTILIFVYGGNHLYFKIYQPEDCIIITSSQQSLNEIVRGVLKYKLQYKVNKVADYRDANLKQYILEHDTIFIYDVPVQDRTKILEYCYQNMKNVYFNPDMHDVIEKSAKHFILDDVSVYCNYSKGLTLEQRFIKRAMDSEAAFLYYERDGRKRTCRYGSDVKGRRCCIFRRWKKCYGYPCLPRGDEEGSRAWCSDHGALRGQGSRWKRRVK